MSRWPAMRFTEARRFLALASRVGDVGDAGTMPSNTGSLCGGRAIRRIEPPSAFPHAQMRPCSGRARHGLDEGCLHRRHWRDGGISYRRRRLQHRRSNFPDRSAWLAMTPLRSALVPAPLDKARCRRSRLAAMSVDHAYRADVYAGGR